MKIQVRRNSWHGKLTRYVYGNDHIKDTKSFCPYFWSIWLACVVAPIKYMVELLDTNITRVGVAIGLISLALGIIFIPTVIIPIMIILIGFSVFIWLIWQFLTYYEEKYPYTYTTRTYEPEEKKQDSVLVTFLKSKKNKVCPMMEEV